MRKLMTVTTLLLACAALSGCITRGCDNKPVETCDTQKPPIGWESAMALALRLF